MGGGFVTLALAMILATNVLANYNSNSGTGSGSTCERCNVGYVRGNDCSSTISTFRGTLSRSINSMNRRRLSVYCCGTGTRCLDNSISKTVSACATVVSCGGSSSTCCLENYVCFTGGSSSGNLGSFGATLDRGGSGCRLCLNICRALSGCNVGSRKGRCLSGTLGLGTGATSSCVRENHVCAVLNSCSSTVGDLGGTVSRGLIGTGCCVNRMCRGGNSGSDSRGCFGGCLSDNRTSSCRLVGVKRTRVSGNGCSATVACFRGTLRLRDIPGGRRVAGTVVVTCRCSNSFTATGDGVRRCVGSCPSSRSTTERCRFLRAE